MNRILSLLRQLRDLLTIARTPSHYNPVTVPCFKPWGVEFRNGGWLQSLDADRSGPAATAMRFASRSEAEAVFSRGEWMFDGPMAKLLPKAGL